MLASRAGMSMRLVVLCVGMLSLSAAARPKSVEKSMAARAEAQDLVDGILRGEGNLNGLLNRVRFIGQEAAVCTELSEVVRRTGDPQQVRNVAQALGTLAHPNGELALLWLTGNEDGATRMYAAMGLGRMKSAQAVPKLLPLLADKSLGVRKETARALGLIRNPKAGGPLLKAAKVEGEVEVRAEMLMAVGGAGDKKQAAGLEGFLGDSSEATRFAAAKGLCGLGAKKGFEFAKKQLSSSDRYERLQGLKLFEGSKAKEASVVLGPMLEDKDRAVAAMAARVLYQGGDSAKLDWLVLQSFHANGEERLQYEKELELLRLADDQRKAILKKAGIQ